MKPLTTLAEVALAGLGPDAIPLLAQILSKPDALTVDVRTGLEKVNPRLEKSASASPDQTLANRLRPALELIGSKESKALAQLLPALKKIERYTAPEGDKNGVQMLGNGFKMPFGNDGKDDE